MHQLCHFYQRFLPPLLCGALLLGGCTSRVERAPSQWEEEAPSPSAPQQEEPPAPVDYSEEAITGAVQLPRWGQQLAIAAPSQDIQVTGENYYISGVSLPGEELLLNGEPVEGRGELGSFGVYVPLEPGENLFVFRQGEESVQRVITRDSQPQPPAVIDNLRKMRPELDVAAFGGGAYTLGCTAPAGSQVTAQVGGQSVSLSMASPTDMEGIPATYLGEITLPDGEGTQLLGPVTYTLDYHGATGEYASEGSLYVTGSQDKLLVRGKDVAASVFAEDSDESGFYSTLLEGGVDLVTQIGGSMYRLGMGGWVFKSAVEPLTQPADYQSELLEAVHQRKGRQETIVLPGAAPAPYRAVRGEEGELLLTLYHTTGLKEVDLQDSALLESVEVAEEGGNTLLTFRLREELWSYLISYGDGGTQILLKGKPPLQEGDRPLTGITVALDPGHGGSDGGTAGLADGIGPGEAAINLATAQAVRTYLEGLGATVRMIREDDSRVELSRRLEEFRSPQVDLAISLHCNSIDPWRDGTKPSGVETYYFEEGSKALASAVQTAILAETGRNNREIKPGYYKVTLNSGAPTVMVEMGFLTNPADYDDLVSPKGIYRMAKAIGDGVLAAL